MDGAMVEKKLTKAEVSDCAMELAGTLKELEDLATAWAAQLKEHGEAKTALEQRTYRLGKEIRTGVREVPAQTSIDDV